MKRVCKPEGKFNIAIEEVATPEPGAGEVRVKAVRSLISRGSEMGGRYTKESAIAPEIMGYSLAGIVDAVGVGVEHIAVGDRVVASAPHAQYVVRRARVSSPQEHAQVVSDVIDGQFRSSALLSAGIGRGSMGGHRKHPSE